MSPLEVLNNQLNENETILWSGTPKKGWAFGLYDFVLIPSSAFWFFYSIVWIVFAFYGLSKTVEDPTWMVYFPFFGIPFVFTGFLFLFARFPIASFIRSKTTYAITNQRIMILSTLLSKRARSVLLENTRRMTISRDSVYFGGDLVRYLFGTFSNLTGLPMHAFHRIEHANEVHELIKTQQSHGQHSQHSQQLQQSQH